VLFCWGRSLLQAARVFHAQQSPLATPSHVLYNGSSSGQHVQQPKGHIPVSIDGQQESIPFLAHWASGEADEPRANMGPDDRADFRNVK
jgi:hypothetical protein